MTKKSKIPAHLGAGGREFYASIVRDYGIDDAAGLALVTTAAECLDRMRAAQAAIKKYGEVAMANGGVLKVNPACRLEKDSRAGFLQSLKQMNLDLEPLRDGPGRPAGTFRTGNGLAARAN